MPEPVRVHILEHADFDGPARILDWAKERGHAVARTALHHGAPLPQLGAFDLLVVLGGPMNIYQHRDFPWLPREKHFLRQAIELNKPIVGICLGAQLLADVLGAKVYQNPVKEIGWFPVRMRQRIGPFESFPTEIIAMHWHGDTFDIPPRAAYVAESEACRNQAFLWGDRVVGLQFHIEMGQVAAAEISDACASELVPARYIQTREQLVAEPPGLSASYTALCGLLDRLAALPNRRVPTPVG